MLVPKVSICIPAYNNVNEVKRLLESIFLQRFKNYEIILTDDSTNNEISELIEQMGRQKIRYIHNPKPLGHIFNWNRALSEAKGEYIKIMFSDDWFTNSDSLEKMAALLDNRPEASLAFCGTMQVPLDSPQNKGAYARCAQKWYIDRLNNDYRNLFLGNEIGAPSATIYRSCDVRFDEKSNWASDMFLYFEILKKNPVFAYTEEALISIGIHEEQYTGMFKEKDIRKFNDMQFLYEKYELWQSKNCRDYMLLQILKFKKGWKTAKNCRISFGSYFKQGMQWFWKNTIQGYWNGALHKAGLRK